MPAAVLTVGHTTHRLSTYLLVTSQDLTALLAAIDIRRPNSSTVLLTHFNSGLMLFKQATGGRVRYA
jgi:hypothetical protein